MKYFKVKPEYDKKPLYKPSQKRHIPNGYVLTRHELFTEKEMIRLNVPRECVTEVECHPSDTYNIKTARFMAGAFSREVN